MKRICLFTILLALSWQLSAQIKLPKVIGSNMVLQQQTKVNLWGWAGKNKTIQVKASWLKQAVETKSDAEGNWAVKLQTPVGSFTAQSITISDGEPVKLENILIGDVWVCSGQSNMEMPVKGFRNQPVNSAFDYIISANKEASNIRMYTVVRERSYDKDLTDSKVGQWESASPKTVADFSAVGYFFAYTLTRAVNVPIGLIASDWGGTKIESWMPLVTLKESVTPQQYGQKLKVDNIKPSELYHGMIAPIRNFSAKGFLWYQGESNLGDIDHYDKMMAAMVARWRKDWGDTHNAMPFYYVQIAPFTYGGKNEITYPLFVENQAKALTLIPNSGMAATTDIGEEMCIHPREKVKVGQRLAALALSQTYGKSGFEAKAPQLLSYEKAKNGKIEVKLSNVDDGLIPWYQEPITGFEIAGADKKFYPAKASISYDHPDMVSVWSNEVKDPVAVRYAFRNFIKANLSNMYGIPVVPFRTDDWNDVK